MQNLKKLFLPIAAFVLLFSTACNQKKDGSFKVTVNYKNADKLFELAGMTGATAPTTSRITLEEIPYGEDQNPVLLDSGRLKGTSGTVTLKGNGKQENIYQLSIENGPMILLVNDADASTVDVDFSKRDDYYTVSGSEAGKELKEFIRAYTDKSTGINVAFSDIDSLKKSGATDSALILATEKKNNEITSLNDYIKSFLTKSTHPAVSLFALGLSSRSFQKEEFEKALGEIVKKFPDHKALGQLKASYEKQQAQPAQQAPQASAWVGKDAPALTLPDVNGKMVSISDFKGKYVLVDFWASWCGPCRGENPNVVKAFNKFKDKNFTILGVSLDKEKEPWQKAIAADKLAWTQVSDLKYWNSAAVQTFKFEGIPYNVLIDPQGKIIGESLRGDDLEKMLASVLK